MKLPKLIALDMDGTMLDAESRLSERTKEALRAAQRAGIRVSAATGRMYPSAMIHIRDIGIESASIFYNGALVRDPLTDETIYERRLGAGLTAELLDFFHKNGWYAQLYCDDRLLVRETDDPRCRFYEEICGLKAEQLGGAFWNCGLDSSKLLGISMDKEEFALMCAKVGEHFGNRIYRATSWGSFIEIAHPEVNKARALERVADHYGIAREDVLALGDGANDIEMLRWAGTGVAMGNSNERVKEAADIAAPPNTEDGAARFIEELLRAAE